MAVGTIGERARSRPTPDGSQVALRVFVALPELVVCAVAGFSLGPMLLLLANQFRPAPVLITGVIGAAIAVGVHGLGERRADPGAGWFTLGALGLVAAWFAANVRYTAESVYATRDPATYNITARWLMSHPSLHIPTNPQVFGFAGCLGAEPQIVPPTCYGGGAGFSPVNATQVYSQGNHLMPALGSVAGWLFGTPGMFRANLVIGALALLALFGLVRRVAGAPLALLALAAMGAGIPMFYVSRDTLSEPLMMLFLLGALGILHGAVGSGRLRHYGLAGYVAGCSAMVRIDSYLSLLSIVVAVGVVAATAAVGERRRAVRAGVVTIAAATGAALVGWLDVTWLSFGYYRDERHNIRLEIEACVLTVVLTVALVALIWRAPVRSWLARPALAVNLNRLAGVAVVAAFAFLASRPFWYVGHVAKFNPSLAAWQAELHQVVDGTRSYNEQNVHWLAEYLGWPTVLLAVGGYLLLLRAFLVRRDYRLAGLLAMGLTMSGLYLWNNQIAPDHPWAMRRFVPVILPMLLLAAVVAIGAIWRWGGLGGRVLAAALGIIAVAVPLAVSHPVWSARDEAGDYAQVQQLCRAIGPHGAVVTVDQETQDAYSQTMRSYCNVPAIGYVGATPAVLAAMNTAAAAHGRTLYVMARTTTPDAIPFAAGSSRTPFTTQSNPTWPHALGGPPDHTIPSGSLNIYLGTVDAAGRVTLVVPPSG